MKEILNMLNASGKAKLDFGRHGIKFTHEGFFGFIMRAYKIRDTWFFNIADADDNWNTRDLDPEAQNKLIQHLKTHK